MDLQVELLRCLNDAQFDVTVREAIAHCSTAATALKEAYKSNVMALEWEAKAEEGKEHQAFAEAFWAVMKACPPEAQGTLMYPLQLLTGNVLLAALMGMTTVAQLQAMEGITTTPKVTPQLVTMGRELPLTVSPPTVPRMPIPPSRTKWQHPSSNQDTAASRAEEEEVAGSDVFQEEHPHWKWKERRPLAKLFKESHWEAFSKDSKVIKVAQWAYHPSHRGMFLQEGSYCLTPIFQEMPQETNFLNTQIYEVQEVWTSWQGLKAATHTAKASQRDIQFFCMVTPTKSPNIMGLKGIHSPQKPYISKVAASTAPGVERRARMKAQS